MQSANQGTYNAVSSIVSPALGQWLKQYRLPAQLDIPTPDMDGAHQAFSYAE